MIAFQRQLNLRNRDVIISKPQKKAYENKASTSGANKNTNDKLENENLGNRKQVIVNKIVASKEQRKERISHKNSLNKIWKKEGINSCRDN